MKTLLAVLILTTCVLAQSTSHNLYDDSGNFWKQMSDLEKTFFLQGWTHAMIQQEDVAFMRCMPAKYDEVSFDRCSRDPYIASLDFGGVHLSQLKDGVDTFYKDFLNQNVYIGWALSYVRDQIKGVAPDKLAAELDKMRHPTKTP